MNRARAIRIAENWSQGHVCTLRDGEAREYHKLCLAALREQEQRERNNKPLTFDELQKRDRPVWYVCKPIVGGDGYWCLCKNGLITTPSGVVYDIAEIPYWVFLPEPPKEGAEG